MEEIERNENEREKNDEDTIIEDIQYYNNKQTESREQERSKSQTKKSNFLQLFTANHEIYKRAKTVTQDDCFREDIHWQIVVCPLGQRLLPVFEWNETNFHNLLILCRFLN